MDFIPGGTRQIRGPGLMAPKLEAWSLRPEAGRQCPGRRCALWHYHRCRWPRQRDSATTTATSTATATMRRRQLRTTGETPVLPDN